MGEIIAGKLTHDAPLYQDAEDRHEVLVDTVPEKTARR
jgi:hypothetical protein